MLRRHSQTGVTLVELMIGLLVGLIVVAGGISVFITSVKGQTDNLKLTRLNQDMRAMIDIMQRDIRRAGFATIDPTVNLATLQNNPFFGATTELTVHNNGTCIVYAYNRDEDPNNDGILDEVPPAVDNNERLGFYLAESGELKMRTSGTTNVDCVNGTWETITEPEVEITALNFQLTSSTLNVTSMATDTDGDGCYDGDDQNPLSPNANCQNGAFGNGLCDNNESCNNCIRDGSPDPACLYVRNVVISLSGRLRDDPTVTQSISEQVRVRNDKYLPPIP